MEQLQKSVQILQLETEKTAIGPDLVTLTMNNAGKQEGKENENQQLLAA